MWLGYTQNGFYSFIYSLQGFNNSCPRRLFRQGGVNTGYQNDHFSIDAGYVTNIADSQEMQDKRINPFIIYNGLS